MSNNIICPHCKKKINIPREANNWIKLGEEKIIRKIYAILKDSDEVKG